MCNENEHDYVPLEIKEVDRTDTNEIRAKHHEWAVYCRKCAHVVPLNSIEVMAAKRQ